MSSGSGGSKRRGLRLDGDGVRYLCRKGLDIGLAIAIEADRQPLLLGPLRHLECVRRQRQKGVLAEGSGQERSRGDAAGQESHK